MRSEEPANPEHSVDRVQSISAAVFHLEQVGKEKTTPEVSRLSRGHALNVSALETWTKVIRWSLARTAKTTEFSSVKLNGAVVEHHIMVNYGTNFLMIYFDMCTPCNTSQPGDWVRAFPKKQKHFSLGVNFMAQPENRTKIKH